MSYVTAADIRVIQQEFTETDKIRVEQICEDIKRYAQKNSTSRSVSFNGWIEPKVKEKLTYLGYKVEQYSDQRDGNFYTIGW